MRKSLEICDHSSTSFEARRLTASMLDTVVQSSREVNRVFGVCVDVRNRAAPLSTTARDIELLAHNGVAHAAKLDHEGGRPLIVLAEFLSGLPTQIAPAVRQLQSHGSQLADTTAQCTKQMRVFYGLLRGLLAIENRLVASGLVAKSALHNIDRTDVRRRVQTILRPNIPEHTRTSLLRLATCSAASARKLRLLIFDSRHTLHDLQNGLLEVRTVARTSRHLSRCLNIEAAYLNEERTHFLTFVERIGQTIDELEGRLTSLGQTIDEGTTIVDNIATGWNYEG